LLLNIILHFNGLMKVINIKPQYFSGIYFIYLFFIYLFFNEGQTESLAQENF